jgi:hypothetical protein
MADGREAPRPPWGPGFVPIHSRWYRVEYAVALVAILYLLVASRGSPAAGPVGSFVGLVLFWFVLPDLVAFLPIGLAHRGRGDWPPWGPLLYNLMHTWLTFGAVFLLASVVTGAIAWPVLGWAVHIAMDRAAGYYLRDSIRPSGPLSSP